MPPSSDPGNRTPTREQRRRARTEEPPELNGPVRLDRYDVEWLRLYEQEAARIRSALGDRVLLLEHVGSTSVPGLAAKPVIDMLLVVADPADETAYVPSALATGWWPGIPAGTSIAC